MLSPGHLARLAGAPAGARPLADGHIELELGDPYTWLPGNPQREDAIASAHEVLAPCLGNERAVFTERLRHNQQ